MQKRFARAAGLKLCLAAGCSKMGLICFQIVNCCAGSIVEVAHAVVFVLLDASTIGSFSAASFSMGYSLWAHPLCLLTLGNVCDVCFKMSWSGPRASLLPLPLGRCSASFFVLVCGTLCMWAHQWRCRTSASWRRRGPLGHWLMLEFRMLA